MKEIRHAKTIWTEKRLKHLFDRYNARYWGGKFPQYTVVISDLAAQDCLGFCHVKERRIEIDSYAALDDREICATLLHEMAHAATPGDGHGPSWQGEMRRLMRVAPVDLKVKLQFRLDAFELAPTGVDALIESRDRGWDRPDEPWSAELLAVLRSKHGVDGQLATRLRAWHRHGRRRGREEGKTHLLWTLFQVEETAEDRGQFLLPFAELSR